MRRSTAIIGVIVILVIGLPVAPHADEAARLYDDARALVEQAESLESASASIPLLERARANLDAIVQRYSASATASRLVLADPLERRLDLALAVVRERAEVERAEVEVQTQDCVRQPSPDCLFFSAMATARGVQDENSRPFALSEIAVAHAAAGQLDTALATAREIEHPLARAQALGQIAAAHAQAEQLEAASEIFADGLDVARGIEVAFLRSLALGSIAAYQAQAGWHDAATRALGDALAIANQIEDEFQRDQLLDRIVQVQAATGQLDAAFTTARAIERESIRAWALSRFAAAQADAGELDAALAGMRGIDGDSALPRSIALGRIAVAQARAEQFDAALATAQGIESQFEKSIALADIAETLAKAGKVDAAERAFENALTNAHTIDSPQGEANALRAIAVAQAGAGQLGAAIATAVEIKLEVYRAVALAQIAVSLAKTDSAPQTYHLLSQKSPVNYREPSFRDLVSTTASGDRPVWQLACLATVYTMLERGRGNAAAMIDDWFADPREHDGRSPGAIRPAYVGGDVPFDVLKLAGELEAGRPVILRAIGGPLGQHFVLAVALEGEGEGRTVRALDPWPGQNASDDAPGHVLQLSLVGAPAHPLIPALTFTHMRLVAA